LRSSLDGGTHAIFILDVTAVDARDADPLLYFERAFRRLG
jgi:flavin reductase (DIM6/NTAB) family NADH-FMN oxidoreductase RutF